MNERTISSPQTSVMKFLFPTIWISMFGVGTVGLFLGTFHANEKSPAPESMKWQFLGMWIAGSAFIWWACCRLKRVRISNDSIYISNYLKEIRVPFDEILDVTESRWINIHPVTIHFRSATAFGDRIVFMPPRRFFNWRVHPIVAELKELAHLPASN